MQLKDIESRTAVLEKAASNLKKKFVGLDNVIDKIIENIRVWYLCPELVRRPTIVCLWGMTGVGKTDLVRVLARELKMQEAYLELQMDAQTKWQDSIQGVLECSSIAPGNPGIVLFDEMQRFRTREADGKEVKQNRYNDLWMLLSDGKFAADGKGKTEIMEMMLDEMYDQDTGAADDDDDDDDDMLPKNLRGFLEGEPPTVNRRKKKTPSRFKQDLWSAKTLKKRLRLQEDLKEIMQWTQLQKMEIIQKKLSDENFVAEEDYTKLLIFICGNLDEAYDMASQVEDPDTEADILHQRSLEISVIDVKTALRKRFGFEQIARFGNTHVIYPCLSSSNFMELIRRTTNTICDDVLTRFGIEVKVSHAVMDMQMRNGVFPSQGVRPLFSTISSTLETQLPLFLLEAMKRNIAQISIEFRDGSLVCPELDMQVSLSGLLDELKNKNTSNFRSMVAVHEAGHAVAYGLLFGLAPLSLKSSIAGFHGGFVISHAVDMDTVESGYNRIKVSMAGEVAETLVFGGKRRSTGNQGDLVKATDIACRLIRYAGTDLRNLGLSCSGVYAHAGSSSHVESIENIEITDPFILKVMDAARSGTVNLLSENKDLLLTLADELMQKGNMSQEEVAEVFASFGHKIVIKDASHQILGTGDDYTETLKKGMEDVRRNRKAQ